MLSINMEANSEKIQVEKPNTVPLKPVWEAYNDAAQQLLDIVIHSFCEEPTTPSSREKYRLVVSSFLALSQQVFNKDGGVMGIPKDKDFWTVFPDAGWRIVEKVRDDLEKAEAIHFVEGTGKKHIWKDDDGRWQSDGTMSVYELDESLMHLPNFFEAEWVEARRPTVLVGVAEHYLTKKDRQRQGILKPKIPVTEVKRQFGKSYSDSSKGVTDLNTFWRQHPLGLPRMGNRGKPYAACATRVYHDGRLDSGGRYYGAWTNLESWERLQSTIDGEPIVSIDLNASQPTLFSSLMGMKMCVEGEWTDLYQHIVGRVGWFNTDEDEKAKRAKAKRVTVEVIGTGNPKKAGPAKQTDDDITWGEEAEVREYTLYRDALLDVVPALSLLDSEYLNGAGFISFQEAEMMTATLHNLIAKGIPAYPVHDCLMVKESDQEEALSTFRETIRGYIKQHCEMNGRQEVVDILVPVSIESGSREKVRLEGLYS